MSIASPLLLVKVTFTAAALADSSWREWSAAEYLDHLLDFFTKAHWLSEDFTAAWFVVLDEPYYRQRLLSVQADTEFVATMEVRTLR